jgi:hypothetical protein
MILAYKVTNNIVPAIIFMPFFQFFKKMGDVTL